MKKTPQDTLPPGVIQTQDLMRALFQLVDTYDADVSGRENPELPDHVDHLLDQFVQGLMSEEQRLEVFDLLKDEPAWTEALALKIKKLNTLREI